MSPVIALLFPLIASANPGGASSPVDVYATRAAWLEALPDSVEAHSAFAYVDEDPALPRVLLIGDSISIGYTPAVRKALDGVANVLRPPLNTGWTARGLDQFERIVGPRPWDVIHFNFGLHDLKVMNGDFANPEYQVPLEAYEANLERLVAQLLPRTRKLIWCTTTPVPENSAGRIAADEIRYNAAAARVMAKHQIPIHDLHRHIISHLSEYQRPANVHFNKEGYDFLGERVAESIRQALAAPGGSGGAGPEPEQAKP